MKEKIEIESAHWSETENLFFINKSVSYNCKICEKCELFCRWYNVVKDYIKKIKKLEIVLFPKR